VVQRYAGRAITGQVKTTPSESVLIESNLPTITSRAHQITTIAIEKSLRLDDSNPRRQLVEAPKVSRTKKTDWRDHSKKEWRDIFGDSTPERFPPTRAPWTETTNVTFKLASERKSEKDEKNREAGYRAIREDEEKFQATIYTDGSAKDSNREGGAGVVYLPHTETLLEKATKLSFPAGKWTSSFQAEMKAIEEAIRLVNIEATPGRPVRIVTDSRSSLDKIKSLQLGIRPNSTIEENIVKGLEEMHTTDIELEILWCPSHCGIEGNEMADECANEGSTMDQEGVNWTFETAKAAIRRKTKRQTIDHALGKRIYHGRQGQIIYPLDENLTRKEQVTLSRLRSGHHPELGYWKTLIGRDEPGTCRLCGSDDPETTEHVFTDCPGLADMYPPGWELTGLATDPKTAIKLWTTWLNRIEAVPDEVPSTTTDST
jgi:ribonuclease HI